MTTPSPTRLPIPQGVQLTLKMTVAGQEAAIVLGGKFTGGWTGRQSAEGWRDVAWANFRGGMLDDVTCTAAIVRVVDGLADEVYEIGAPPSPTGFVTGSPGLLAGSTLIKWSTAQGGRSGKGRTFLPGLAAASINADGRTLTSAYQASVQPYLASYLGSSGPVSVGITPAVLSFKKGAAYAITAGAVASVVGLQRRRMR